MKIIGYTANGYMIDANRDEIANLLGCFASYSLKNQTLTYGTEIKISDMYNQLYRLNQMRDSIEGIQKQMKNMINTLTEIDPILADITNE